MGTIAVTPHIRLEEFENFHIRHRAKVQRAVTLRELGYTFITSILVSPFLLGTFFLIPMMGQISVGLAGLLTAIYLWYRRSLLVACVALSGSGIFSAFIFATIQGIKHNLEVPLFIIIALGIPVTTIYTIFIAARIWVIRGGID